MRIRLEQGLPLIRVVKRAGQGDATKVSHPAARAVLSAGALGGAGLALFSAASSALVCAASLTVLYHLMSRVLGLEIDVDPSALLGNRRSEPTDAAPPN